MMRTSLLFLFLSVILFSKTELHPTQCCPAYNNMKHTRNSGSIMLDLKKQYEVKQHHKGQYLIQIKGANPSQRWVDEYCLAPESKMNVAPADCDIKPIEGKESEQKGETSLHENLLALSWHNAFCETHRYKKECKRGWKNLLGKSKSDNNFVLHGLWPQPRNHVYCEVERRYITADKYKQWNKLPEPKLSGSTKAKLRGVMPGIDSNLHRHEWIKHGTCYGTDAEMYFKDAITLTNKVRNSDVARFFQKNVGKRITIQRLREVFEKSFGKGTGSRVELRCNRGLITEIWLHLGSKRDDLSSMLRNGKKIYSRCQRGTVDRVGYGR